MSYTPPSVAGKKFSAGAGSTLQAMPEGMLCTLADAELIQKVLGGLLVNAVDVPSLNMTFQGVDPNDAAQPWYLIDVPAPGFVGPDVVTMYAAGPGATPQIDPATKVLTWKPAPPPVVVPTPTPAQTAADEAAAADAVMGRTPGVPSGSSSAALTTAQAAQLTHIEKMLVALLAADRVQDPGV